MMRNSLKPFDSGLTRTQTVLGWCYVPLHIVVLPLLLSLFSAFSGTELDTITLNTIYYGAGMAFVLIFMLKFLRRDFDVLLDHPGQAVLTIIMAYFIDLLLSYAVMLVLQLLLSVIANPNNEQVAEMAGESTGSVFGLAVLIGPIVEEVLFRGVVFGSVRKKSRVLAYVLSIALFSIYHIWQYAIAAGDPSLLIYALQYVPVSFALAWAYERSGSIWTTIFLHMGLNAMSLLAMNMFG